MFRVYYTVLLKNKRVRHEGEVVLEESVAKTLVYEWSNILARTTDDKWEKLYFPIAGGEEI